MELLKLGLGIVAGYFIAKLVLSHSKLVGYQGYGGGTVAITGRTPLTAGSYDEAQVIPCITGNC